MSGEHRTLPEAELKAISEAEGIPLLNLISLDQVVIASSNPQLFSFLSKRAVMVKAAGTVLGISDVNEGVEGVIRVLSESRICEMGGFGHVSFRRIKRYGNEIRYRELVEAIITRSSRFCRDPSAGLLDVIVTEGVVVIGLRRYTRDLKRLRCRDPQRRPVYRPGTLTPVWSRLFVNLSRASISKGSLFVDPFCGVGGFLLEACDMGIKYCGSDINWEYVEGARINLKHYGCLDNVVVANACDLPFSRADAIGTDPPYGRLTQPGGVERLEDLMECFLAQAHDIISPDGYVAFAQRADIPVEEVVEKAGFEIVERHLNWVHGALTRDIFVVRKK